MGINVSEDATKDCAVIGTVDEFGGDEFFTELAKKGGDADKVDTCDLAIRYGGASAEPAVMAKFFRDESNKLRPITDIKQRIIPFYDEYPQGNAVMRHMLDDMVDQSSHKRTLIEVSVGRMDWLYGALAALHKKYNVPYADEEVVPFMGTLLGSEKAPEVTNALLEWACSSEDFPIGLLGNADKFFGMFGVIDENLRKQLHVLLTMASQMCEEERLAKANAPKQQLKELQIGDVVPVKEVKDAVGKNRFSVLYIWSPGCPVCLNSMSFVNQMHGKLKIHKAAVVGVHMQEEQAICDEMRKSSNSAWVDLGLDEASFKAVNDWGVVPRFYIVDTQGNILDIINGGGALIEPYLEKALKKIISTYGQNSI
ncbi:MAG: redoxin domain-containing protein [Deltaproteobacteria bacterium]|nr:redoxin domain-containing protein [Deltaproteobacteria bacterium]